MKPMKKNYYLYGKHAVESAILNESRNILEILCTEQNAGEIKRICKKNIKISIVDNNHLKSLFREHVPHQGVVAMVKPIATSNIPREILENNNSKIVILDQITDPQNLGAILRSAAAFGISALIYPKDGSVSESGVVAKAACGALDIVPLIEVVNISNIILELKKNGFWVLGLDGLGKQNINNGKILEGKIAIVMGSEGSGLRPLVAKNCDILVKIPISNQMESLNVSNAASIVFYEINRSNQQQ